MDRLLILKKNDPFYKYLYAIQNQKKKDITFTTTHPK